MHPLRHLLPAFVALLSSGCLQYVLVMGNPSQKAAAYQKVIGDAVGDSKEKNDCPRWIAGLNSIKEKLPIVSGSGTNSTWYGDEIRGAYHRCTLEALKGLKSTEGTELERLKVAGERMDRVLSLPLAPLKIEDTKLGGHSSDEVLPGVASLTKLRADAAQTVTRLEIARAQRVARETKRVEAAKTAEAKGWTMAALAAWTAVAPLDKAMDQQKAAALLRLGAAARQQLAVPVAIVPAGTDGAPEAVLAQVRSASAITSKPTLRLVETPAQATVQVQLAVGAFKKESAKQPVNFQHTWVSGSKTVPNPDIEKLKKDIAYNDKEAAWNDEKSRNACSGNRDKSNCSSRVTHANSAKSHREKAARARQDLAKAKPTVRKDVTSIHEYSGEKTVYVASAPVTVTLTSATAQAPSKQTSAAKVERATIVYAGNEKVGLAARKEAAPTPEELDGALTTECARLIIGGVVNAASLAAGEFDQKAAASTEPLEQLHYALLRALRSGAPADQQKVSALAMPLLEDPVPTALLARAMSRAPGAAAQAPVNAETTPIADATPTAEVPAAPLTPDAGTTAEAPAMSDPAPAVGGTAAP